jgi:hypothetical protein
MSYTQWDGTRQNNNNNARLRDLILLFKILLDMRKDFLLIYKQFERATSKPFTSPVLDYAT